MPLARPVENIVFERDPQAGAYRILVHHYATRPGQPSSTPFRVTIRRAGQPDQVVPGTVTTGQVSAVATFQVP